jgi:antirestriction protein ArdC
MKRDVYAEVSARIVAELEAGAAPWIKPWSATPGANTRTTFPTCRAHYPGGAPCVFRAAEEALRRLAAS